MRATKVLLCLLATAGVAVAAHAQTKGSASGQLNQANQSGRTFDGNRAGSGNSTLNTRDAVRAQPPASQPNNAQRQQEAIDRYRASGAANPAPKVKPSAPPPSPTRNK